jgi:hypothetical protein
MSQRLILRGALEEKKMARIKLAARAAGIIRALKIIVQPAAVTPLEELKSAEAAELAAELDGVRGQYLKLCSEIVEIEQELGE